LLVGLLRDVSCIAGGESTGIVHFDLARQLARLASHAPLDAWLQGYGLAEETLSDLDVRYANKRIALENLLLGFEDIRKGQRVRGAPAV
jgi:hypothetical protein